MKRLVIVLLAAILAISACGDDSSDDAADGSGATTTGSPTTEPPEATTTTAPACAKPADAGRVERTLEIGGLTRQYLLYVPAGYDGSTEVDLYFNLHGSGSSAAAQIEGSELERVADAHRFVIVAPDAGVQRMLDTGEVAITGGLWNTPGVVLTDGSTTPADAPDDVAYIEALVDQLSTDFCVNRVYSTGTSGGGRMSSALACFSDRFDGIAPVAGLRLPEDCVLDHGVDIVAFHGTEDAVNPYLGGGPAYWGPVTVPEAAAAWAALQACTTGPTRTEVSASVVLDEWTGCIDGVGVALYTVNGGGHNWPGGIDAAAANPEYAAFVGVTTQEIDAGELMWEHFTATP